MDTAQSATAPVFIRVCGTYLTLKVSKMRVYHYLVIKSSDFLKIILFWHPFWREGLLKCEGTLFSHR